MDTLDLKAAWQLLQQDIVKKDKVAESTIQQSLHQASQSEVSKIKRSLYLKFTIATFSILIVCSAGLATYFKPDLNPLDTFFSSQESAIFYLMLLISIATMVYFNYQAYRQLHKLQQSTCNLREHLESLIHAMHRAMNFNIYSDTFMTPLFATWFYYAYAFKNHTPGFDSRTALLFILPASIGVLSYFLQCYMQKLKFGQYVNRLKQYLASL